MQGLLENRPVLYGLAGTAGAMLLCAAQVMPAFNAYLELVPLPAQVRAPLCLSVCLGAEGVAGASDAHCADAGRCGGGLAV
jgi:hypothetical protein